MEGGRERERERERANIACRMAFRTDFGIVDAPQITSQSPSGITELDPSSGRTPPSILAFEKNVRFRSQFRLPESQVLLSDYFPTQCNLDWKNTTSSGLFFFFSLSLPPSFILSPSPFLSLHIILCLTIFLSLTHSHSHTPQDISIYLIRFYASLSRHPLSLPLHSDAYYLSQR